MRPSTILQSPANPRASSAPHMCSLCESVQTQPYLTVDGYNIARCSRCRFMFVAPMPAPTELEHLYAQAGYYEDSDLGYADYLGDRARHEQLAERRLRRIERLLPGTGSVLDVGCAAGFFLNTARSRGWRTVGVEISPEMRAYAEGLLGHAVVPTLDELEIAPDSLDAVTLWEYIEHVPDPLDEVRRVAALLRPGGILALSTPNTGYWTASYQPERWREFKPPAHLGFFTRETLHRLLDSSGLAVIAVDGVVARAPAQPYALQRLLMLLRKRVGSGEDRRSPWWWSFSLAWRAVEQISRMAYRWNWPGSDLHIGLEAYARKAVS